ncbi:MAG: DUF969 domain-containing protein [Candidatus Eisenbacteria bacterium]|nr:DUF969 domain-containing protein [Candidatus Eisenbacteria bacterium]
MSLLGIAVLVLGFVLRANPLLIVLAAALVTGLAAAWTPGADAASLGQAAVATLSAFGKAFNTNRYVSVVWLVLAAIGMLERLGLQERARTWIAGVHAATVGRLLAVYFVLRQVTSALGLTSLGGHAQMVRPLVAPMAEGAAEARYGPLGDRVRFQIRAHCAAADNIALFFGEDIFIAIASILLIKGFLEQSGVAVEPFELSRWAIPTAVAALVIHVARLWLFERRLECTLGRKERGE